MYPTLSMKHTQSKQTQLWLPHEVPNNNLIKLNWKPSLRELKSLTVIIANFVFWDPMEDPNDELFEVCFSAKRDF